MVKKNKNDSPAQTAAQPTSNPLESADLRKLPLALKAAHVRGSLATVQEAKVLNIQNRERYNAVIEGNKALEKMLRSRRESLLPSEFELKEVIDSRLNELPKRSSVILEWLDTQHHDLEIIRRANEMAQGGYPVLDWRTFLAWKKKEESPALIVVDALATKVARVGHAIASDEVVCLGKLRAASPFETTLERFYRRGAAEPLYGVYPDNCAPIPWVFEREHIVIGYLAGTLPKEMRDRVRSELNTGNWDDVLFLVEPAGQYEPPPRDILVLGRIGEYLFLITECRLLDTNESPSLKDVPLVYNGIDGWR